ncbi:MAG: hypothetical protein QM539_06440 [Alphaproteobacteria bacterium]|nr:hypothetical protein [Alphaproteobacteria bacterium]
MSTSYFFTIIDDDYKYVLHLCLLRNISFIQKQVFIPDMKQVRISTGQCLFSNPELNLVAIIRNISLNKIGLAAKQVKKPLNNCSNSVSDGTKFFKTKFIFMLQNALKLGQQLTKKEMREVKGGGTCQAQDFHGDTLPGLSRAQAIELATQSHGHWCCQSCSRASWAQH